MSKIEWTEKTWNPIIWCGKISAGCKNCYAIRMAWRLAHNPKMAERYEGVVSKGASGQVNWTGRLNYLHDVLLVPLKTKKPTTFFVNSMSDLFHEGVDFDFVDMVFAVMAATPQHTYQVLTKRPDVALEWYNKILETPLSWAAEDIIENLSNSDTIPHDVLQKYLDDYSIGKTKWPLPNVWLGVSVEHQQAADERIPVLLRLPAAKRFLSCEPLLDRVDLTSIYDASGRVYLNALGGTKQLGPQDNFVQLDNLSKIDWVIVGGESGHNARGMHYDLPLHIMNQCKEYGVPFFFKQWGEYNEDGVKVGKKKAGCKLFGEEFKEMPV